MKIIGVIPARYASSRLPGKVLADLGGKPMIQHVWERAKQARSLSEVYIACDDQRVFSVSRNFGAKAIMTAPELASGTDRIAAAVKDIEADIVLNIQGDEPLIHFETIESLALGLKNEKDCTMATVVRMMADPADVLNPNVVKVVLDHNGFALYFSRSVIPFDRDGGDFSRLTYYKHFGLYAYRKNFLLAFHQLPFSHLEQTERLEQLRVLEAGYKIKTVTTPHDSISVDTKEDLAKVIGFLRDKRL
jgi:3-deoxy-manno-octulosonate cytidylyltransferase (CMP-KDO synthetase)